MSLWKPASSLSLLCIVLLAVAALRPGAVAARQTAQAGGTTNVAASAAAPDALIKQYCVTCHSQRAHIAGLVLEGHDLKDVGKDSQVWEKVVRKLRAGVMPPVGQPRPEPAVYDRLTLDLETALDRASAQAANPGRVNTFHRLNRAEYQNAIRDLFDLDQDVSALLPSDDASYGFDNMAGVLKLSSSVLERYLAVASKISRQAVNPPDTPVAETFKVSPERSQNERQEGLPFGTRGGGLFQYHFPRDGEYLIKVSTLCTTETDVPCNGALGFSEPHQLEITLDGVRVQLFTLEPVQRDYRASDAGISKSYGFEARVPVKAGPHDLGVTFIKTIPSVDYVRNGYRQRFERPYRFNADVMGIAMPFVETVVVSGPFHPEGPGETPSRHKIFSCRPASAAAEAGCARSILTSLARRAYRRPPTDAEMSDLLSFYEEGRKGATFDDGIERSLRRMLVSLNFLFRIELDPQAAAGETAAYRISDFDLASRLSFFLWSSIPDDALLTAAEKGTLHKPDVLAQQVRRMLADDRSSAFVENFTGQWLRLRNLTAVRPSEALFPDFDDALRDGLRRETELFFQSIVREDRSAMELLTADYTFLNERLAKHYGVPNVYGPEFRRVVLKDGQRRGLLGKGSILTVTSPAIRTSPVQRGKWILENVLGSPPPPPPPDVPVLPEAAPGSRAKRISIREKMAQHRANPVCSSCHSVIDPVGFALENFNWVGQWRDVDDAFEPVDASGRLPDGTTFKDLNGFRDALTAKPERFVGLLTEKLLTYATGRGVEYYDMPTVRTIRRTAAANNYRFSSIIMSIVTSDAFQMRRAAS